MFNNESFFNKENLDIYLKELAKEFRKINGNHMTAELILVGGAAILANYNFRDSTRDIDAVCSSSSSIKEAVNRVSDKLDLPNEWLNADFMRTASYSPHLREHSSYYKTFYNVLEVRTISSEYLVAMKLMSGRHYKNDLSDIVNILIAQKENNDPLTLERIKKAVIDLYDDWDKLPHRSIEFIERVMNDQELENVHKAIRLNEIKTGQAIIQYQNENPDVIITNDILDEIISKSSDEPCDNGEDEWNEDIEDR